MIAFDRQEALRYLGYRNTEPDTAVADSLAQIGICGVPAFPSGRTYAGDRRCDDPQ